MKIRIISATALAAGLTFSAVACGLETPPAPIAEQGTATQKAEKKAKTKVKLTATKRPGQDPLGDYVYEIELTNRTGEPLQVDAFSFQGEDNEGNVYDALPADLNSVTLADGKSVDGTITFSTPKIVKILYSEMLGVDRAETKVKQR